MTTNVKGTPIVKGLGFDSFGLGANACTVDIDEEQDKILRIRPFHFDEHQTPEELNAWKLEARGKTFEPGFKTLISPLSLCYKKRVYSKNHERLRAHQLGRGRADRGRRDQAHARRVQPRGHPVRDRRPRRDEGRPRSARLHHPAS